MIDDTPISVASIALFDKETGALAMICPGTFPLGAGQSWVRLPTGYSDETHAWDATTRMMVEDPAKAEARLLAALKTEAERRKMVAVSPGGAKKLEYDDKASEIAASATIADTDLNSLSTPAAMERFPSAATEQALTGEPLATILARYRAGAETSMPEIRRLSAIEQDATRQIRSATTATGKRAAAAAINWTWKP